MSATHPLRSGGFELPTAAAGGAGVRPAGESPRRPGRRAASARGGPERRARDERAQPASTPPWRRNRPQGRPRRGEARSAE